VAIGKQNTHKVETPTNGYRPLNVLIGSAKHGNKQDLGFYLVLMQEYNLNFILNVRSAIDLGRIR
jgi:hypothetical protein